MKESLLSRSWIDENSLLTRSWTDESILGWVAKTFYDDEATLKTDLINSNIWWNVFFVEMEAGLMKIV